MDDLQIKQLIKKYLDGQCLPEEIAFVESWYLKQSTAFREPGLDVVDKNEQLMWEHLQGRISHKRRVRLWPRIAVASVLAVIVIGVYLFSSSNDHSRQQSKAAIAANIPPGKNGATLTLANGQRILINDAVAGNIASQSGVKIYKTKDGQLIYELTGQGGSNNEYNTLTTIRGEQMQLRLPDGSLVFLNAASSLKYPTSFTGSSKRAVSLTGEGYFEVAKDSKHPFVVATSKQEVEVLGTHFNINSYADEKAITTTLLEGSVRVLPGATKSSLKSRVLKPGQQSVLNEQGVQVTEVNPAEAVAWQKGYFSFYDEDIKTVMRKVSRWYNIDVAYSGDLPELGFSARITKYSSITDVLEVLEKTKAVHFEIEGRNVIVSK